MSEDAPFDLQGPDDNGDAWICSPAGEPDAWCHNLGPWEGAAEAMSQWLGSLDYDEIEARRDPDALEREWLDRMKQTMALDVGRFMSAGMPPKAIVEKLFDIPEVREAFAMRAKGRNAA